MASRSAGGELGGEPVPGDLAELDRAAHRVNACERDAPEDEGMDSGVELRPACQSARRDAAAIAHPSDQSGEGRTPDDVDGTGVGLLLECLRRGL